MNQDEKVTFSDRVDSFFAQHRKKVLVALSTLFVVVIAVIAIFMVIERQKKAAITKIETEIIAFEKFKSEKIKNSANSMTDEEKKLLADEEATLIEKLTPYSVQNNYAGFMAVQYIADIYFKNGDFEKALSFYEKLNLPKELYTSGVVFYNAAACADELGQNEKAIDFYRKAANCVSFPFKARALFNAARVQENIDASAAVDAYTKVVADYPNSEWALLSKTRVIELGLVK